VSHDASENHIVWLKCPSYGVTHSVCFLPSASVWAQLYLHFLYNQLVSDENAVMSPAKSMPIITSPANSLRRGGSRALWLAVRCLVCLQASSISVCACPAAHMCLCLCLCVEQRNMGYTLFSNMCAYSVVTQESTANIR